MMTLCNLTVSQLQLAFSEATHRSNKCANRFRLSSDNETDQRGQISEQVEVAPTKDIGKAAYDRESNTLC